MGVVIADKGDNALMFLKRNRGGDLALAIVVGVVVGLILTASNAWSVTKPPTVPAVTAKAYKTSLKSPVAHTLKVKCATTKQTYVYLCDLTGRIKATGKVVCYESYVYDPGGGKPQTLWTPAWICGQKPYLPVPAPPNAPPA